MCIGIPMQVARLEGAYAWCEGMGEQRRVDTLLVGSQPVGTWLLVFLGSAREVLSDQNAARITSALQAVGLAMQGDADIGHLFQDLVDRPPQLPQFLRQTDNEPAGD